MTRVAILWHMHQPYYEDLLTGEHILPWVRLHALKDYYGMVAMLEEFPDVRMTFNLVPSLLVQLEASADERARDRYLELGLKPAAELEAADVTFVLKNFFHAYRPRMIDVYPRYAELLAMRGPSTTEAALEAARRRFDVAALRDLQVWQKLVWLDPIYLENDPRVRALVAKDRLFSESDKAVLRQVELEILRAVIPAYRERLTTGQIEISTSPFYHPILPLLCDTEVYRRTHPDSSLPRQLFRRPDDAVAQLERAVEYHRRLFGRRPIGVWPSEGSVSDAVISLAAAAGFQWMATDELILARSLGVDFTRDGAGHVNHPERLYAPYCVHADTHELRCAFRDHVLSDLIGFTYAAWPASRAVDDFVGRLTEAGRRFAARTGGEEATIFVILDGENAWEHFEGGGRPFLRTLYRRLSNHSEIRTVTMAEACGTTGPTPRMRSLTGIFPGSWIDANFYVWIGHRDDQRAWRQLAEAREVLDAAAPSRPTARAEAYEELLIAEGSDWFWWYGDDHSSEHDLEFDDLFRRHVRNVYQLLERAIPDELFVSNITTGVADHTQQVDATGLVMPKLDGENSSYFEWLGAGSVEIRSFAGAMHRSDGAHSSLLTRIKAGVGGDRLFVRFDAGRPASALLAEGHSFRLIFLDPGNLRVMIAPGPSGPEVSLSTRSEDGRGWRAAPLPGASAAAASILEVAVPLSAIQPAGPAVAFLVALHAATGIELERHPAHRPITIVVPGSRFEASNWSA